MSLQNIFSLVIMYFLNVQEKTGWLAHGSWIRSNVSFPVNIAIGEATKTNLQQIQVYLQPL